MGCDIHSFVEVKKEGKWQKIEDKIFKDYGDRMTSEPFGWRSYSVFGFLADVRNYSHCPVLVEPRGLPLDSEWLNQPSKYAYDKNPMSGEVIPYEERETNKKDIENDWNYHTCSHIYLKELLEFDYTQKFEDRRYSKKEITPGGGMVINGAAISEPGQGTMITFREHLGSGFFEDLMQLKMLGEPEGVRIVFYFDN